VDTTVGRAMVWEIVPEGLPFELVDKPLGKKAISQLINQCYRAVGLKDTVVFADQIMYWASAWPPAPVSPSASTTWRCPTRRPAILERAEEEVKEIEDQYTQGLVTNGERYNKVVDIWSRTNDQVAKSMMRKLGKETRSSTAMGTRGAGLLQLHLHDGRLRCPWFAAQIRQLAGMRGLMAKPDGSIIETPITANFREGLNVIQYFISTHGARKGLADTALKTANSGYLTRRLVDVAQDMVVLEVDCGTEKRPADDADHRGRRRRRAAARAHPRPRHRRGRLQARHRRDRLRGRHAARRALGPELEDRVSTRCWCAPPITCEARVGYLRQCYGRDLARGHRVNIGEAVGVIAAQSIGEPGTQLTMRTFHIGGAASRAAAVSNVQVKAAVPSLHNIKTVQHHSGNLVAVSRSGELTCQDDKGPGEGALQDPLRRHRGGG
jgi:DNA-directed RNA polymerase subunit beta'